MKKFFICLLLVCFVASFAYAKKPIKMISSDMEDVAGAAVPLLLIIAAPLALEAVDIGLALYTNREMCAREHGKHAFNSSGPPHIQRDIASCVSEADAKMAWDQVGGKVVEYLTHPIVGVGSSVVGIANNVSLLARNKKLIDVPVVVNKNPSAFPSAPLKVREWVTRASNGINKEESSTAVVAPDYANLVKDIKTGVAEVNKTTSKTKSIARINNGGDVGGQQTKQVVSSGGKLNFSQTNQSKQSKSGSSGGGGSSGGSRVIKAPNYTALVKKIKQGVAEVKKAIGNTGSVFNIKKAQSVSKQQTAAARIKSRFGTRKNTFKSRPGLRKAVANRSKKSSAKSSRSVSRRTSSRSSSRSSRR